MIACCWFFSFVSAQEQNGDYRIRTVVIDPGHGGRDPGSVGKKTTESKVVLAISLKVGEYIENLLPEVKVIYTRKTDEFIPLYQRAEIANQHKADLFISIHANGNVNTQASGTETLLLGYHRANENFEVAKNENSVILLEDDYSVTYEGFDPNSAESYIMFSLLQERFFERSINFAALVQDQFRERAMRKDRGVHRQGLLVLAQTAMPGVLIETGFITNPEEEAYLISDYGQDIIASAIFRAFRDYKNIVESKSNLIATSGNTLPEVTGTPSEAITFSGTGSPSKSSTLVEAAGSPVEFKVQITASKKKIPSDSPMFAGLPSVTEYETGGMYKYAVESAYSFDEIMNRSSKIKERFPDAFIIGVKDGKIIPLNQALQETSIK